MFHRPRGSRLSSKQAWRFSPAPRGYVHVGLLGFLFYCTSRYGAWSLELRNFTSRRQQDLSFESAPTPPSAGFNVAFEDPVLN